MGTRPRGLLYYIYTVCLRVLCMYSRRMSCTSHTLGTRANHMKNGQRFLVHVVCSIVPGGFYGTRPPRIQG